MRRLLISELGIIRMAVLDAVWDRRDEWLVTDEFHTPLGRHRPYFNSGFAVLFDEDISSKLSRGKAKLIPYRDNIAGSGVFATLSEDGRPLRLESLGDDGFGRDVFEWEVPEIEAILRGLGVSESDIDYLRVLSQDDKAVFLASTTSDGKPLINTEVEQVVRDVRDEFSIRRAASNVLVEGVLSCR